MMIVIQNMHQLVPGAAGPHMNTSPHGRHTDNYRTNGRKDIHNLMQIMPVHANPPLALQIEIYLINFNRIICPNQPRCNHSEHPSSVRH